MGEVSATGRVVVSTIGHSTRTLAELLEILLAHGIEHVIDVRTIPRSRRNPQFNRDTLPAELGKAGFGYVHLPGLGGLRLPRPDSINRAWRNASFRGYADHMQTPTFAENLAVLQMLAERKRIALMCAEAVPWRCHRSLIADALTAHGLRVEHLLSSSQRAVHAIHGWARLDGGRVTYPAAAQNPPSPVEELPGLDARSDQDPSGD